MSPAIITLIILLITVILLVTEKIPMALTAMMCSIALVLTGVIDAKTAFSYFGNSNIILFAAMFVIGYAFFETGMANKVGGLITRFTKTERQLVIVLMLVSGVLSMFLSNTGTTAVFMPLVIGLAASSGFSRSRLLYAMMVSVSIGGTATLLGGPGWLLVKAQVEQSVPGATFGLFEPSKIGIPLFIISFIFMATVGYRMTPVREGELEQVSKEEAATKQEKAAKIPAWKGKVAVLVLIGTVIAMIFESTIGIPLWLSAVIGAMVLVLTGTISENEAYKAISWKTLFMFAGILPLSIALKTSGAGDMIGNAMLKMMGNTTNPYVITAVLILIPMIMTNFMSSATTMALMSPIGVSVALKMGADPTAVIMAIAFSSTLAIATPIGQPGNAMIYGPSGLEFRDYARAGLPLTAIMYVIVVFMVPSIWPFFA